MARQIKIPTVAQRLDLAIKLNEQFDALCREASFPPDARIMALALQARVNAQPDVRHGDGTCTGKISITIGETGGSHG